MSIRYFLLLTTMMWVSESQAQIKLASYEKETKCHVDSLRKVAKIRASSPCGIVSIEWDDQVFSGGCAGTVVRTYTFTDPCDSVTTAQQYISLYDNIAPLLKGLPELAEITLQKDEPLPPVPTVTALDNSGEACEVVFEQHTVPNGVERRWTARDRCENEVVFRQTIRCAPCE